MTKTIKFEGSSDDTFGGYGPGIDCDHDNCANGDPISIRVSGSGGEMLVTGQYCPGAASGWQVSVAPSHNDPDENPIPEWPMRIERASAPYSARLVVEAPDDVELELVQ